jgi:hypothetical protein
LDLQSGFRIIRSVCCDCFATIRPSILTTSLGLTLLPICSVCCCVTATETHPVGHTDSELTSSPPVVLTDWLPSLSTPSTCRSLSMPFRFHHPASPVLQYVSLLTGFALCTTLGVGGRWRTRTACSS